MMLVYFILFLLDALLLTEDKIGWLLTYLQLAWFLLIVFDK